MIRRFDTGMGIVWLLRPIPSTSGFGWEYVGYERYQL